MATEADWVEVGDRVFSRRYHFADQQIGVVLGDGEALVVDTRSTSGQAQELLRDIGRLTSDPVRVAVNTHWHWDHAFGNHDLRPAVIWGHERCRTQLVARAEEMVARIGQANPELGVELAAVIVDPPERTFSEAETIAVGGRPVELRYLGRGHTDADIVILVPDADVLFAGDLLENDAVPFFGDGYPMDWPGTARGILELVHGPVVPGHGSIGDRAFVERQVLEFEAVAETARRAFAGELHRVEALALMPYPQESAIEPLKRALAQLRGELD